MFTSEKQGKRQKVKVPALNDEREKYFQRKVNGIVSGRTDKGFENSEEGQRQESCTAGTRVDVRRIAVLHPRLRRGAEL